MSINSINQNSDYFHSRNENQAEQNTSSTYSVLPSPYLRPTCTLEDKERDFAYQTGIVDSEGWLIDTTARLSSDFVLEKHAYKSLESVFLRPITLGKITKNYIDLLISQREGAKKRGNSIQSFRLVGSAAISFLGRENHRRILADANAEALHTPYTYEKLEKNPRDLDFRTVSSNPSWDETVALAKDLLIPFLAEPPESWDKAHYWPVNADEWNQVLWDDIKTLFKNHYNVLIVENWGENIVITFNDGRNLSVSTPKQDIDQASGAFKNQCLFKDSDLHLVVQPDTLISTSTSCRFDLSVESEDGHPAQALIDMAYGFIHIEPSRIATKDYRTPINYICKQIKNRVCLTPGTFDALLAKLIEHWVRLRFNSQKVASTIGNIASSHFSGSANSLFVILSGLDLALSTKKALFLPHKKFLREDFDASFVFTAVWNKLVSQLATADMWVSKLWGPLRVEAKMPPQLLDATIVLGGALQCSTESVNTTSKTTPLAHYTEQESPSLRLTLSDSTALHIAFDMAQAVKTIKNEYALKHQIYSSESKEKLNHLLVQISAIKIFEGSINTQLLKHASKLNTDFVSIQLIVEEFVQSKDPFLELIGYFTLSVFSFMENMDAEKIFIKNAITYNGSNKNHIYKLLNTILSQKAADNARIIIKNHVKHGRIVEALAETKDTVLCCLALELIRESTHLPEDCLNFIHNLIVAYPEGAFEYLALTIDKYEHTFSDAIIAACLKSKPQLISAHFDLIIRYLDHNVSPSKATLEKLMAHSLAHLPEHAIHLYPFVLKYPDIEIAVLSPFVLEMSKHISKIDKIQFLEFILKVPLEKTPVWENICKNALMPIAEEFLSSRDTLLIQKGKELRKMLKLFLTRKELAALFDDQLKAQYLLFQLDYSISNKNWDLAQIKWSKWIQKKAKSDLIQTQYRVVKRYISELIQSAYPHKLNVLIELIPYLSQEDNIKELTLVWELCSSYIQNRKPLQNHEAALLPAITSIARQWLKANPVEINPKKPLHQDMNRLLQLLQEHEQWHSLEELFYDLSEHPLCKNAISMNATKWQQTISHPLFQTNAFFRSKFAKTLIMSEYSNQRIKDCLHKVAKNWVNQADNIDFHLNEGFEWLTHPPAVELLGTTLWLICATKWLHASMKNGYNKDFPLKFNQILNLLLTTFKSQDAEQRKTIPVSTALIICRSLEAVNYENITGASLLSVIPAIAVKLNLHLETHREALYMLIKATQKFKAFNLTIPFAAVKTLGLFDHSLDASEKNFLLYLNSPHYNGEISLEAVDFYLDAFHYYFDHNEKENVEKVLEKIKKLAHFSFKPTIRVANKIFDLLEKTQNQPYLKQRYDLLMLLENVSGSYQRKTWNRLCQNFIQELVANGQLTYLPSLLLKCSESLAVVNSSLIEKLLSQNDKNSALQAIDLLTKCSLVLPLEIWKTVWSKVASFKLTTQLAELLSLFNAQYPYQKDTLHLVKPHYLCLQALKVCKSNLIKEHVQRYSELAHYAIKECSNSVFAISIINMALPFHSLESQKLLWEQASSKYAFSEVLPLVETIFDINLSTQKEWDEHAEFLNQILSFLQNHTSDNHLTSIIRQNQLALSLLEFSLKFYSNLLKINPKYAESFIKLLLAYQNPNEEFTSELFKLIYDNKFAFFEILERVPAKRSYVLCIIGYLTTLANTLTSVQAGKTLSKIIQNYVSSNNWNKKTVEKVQIVELYQKSLCILVNDESVNRTTEIVLDVLIDILYEDALVFNNTANSIVNYLADPNYKHKSTKNSDRPAVQKGMSPYPPLYYSARLYFLSKLFKIDPTKQNIHTKQIIEAHIASVILELTRIHAYLTPDQLATFISSVSAFFLKGNPKAEEYAKLRSDFVWVQQYNPIVLQSLDLFFEYHNADSLTITERQAILIHLCQDIVFSFPQHHGALLSLLNKEIVQNEIFKSSIQESLRLLDTFVEGHVNSNIPVDSLLGFYPYMIVVSSAISNELNIEQKKRVLAVFKQHHLLFWEKFNLDIPITPQLVLHNMSFILDGLTNLLTQDAFNTNDEDPIFLWDEYKFFTIAITQFSRLLDKMPINPDSIEDILAPYIWSFFINPILNNAAPDFYAAREHVRVITSFLFQKNLHSLLKRIYNVLYFVTPKSIKFVSADCRHYLIAAKACTQVIPVNEALTNFVSDLKNKPLNHKSTSNFKEHFWAYVETLKTALSILKKQKLENSSYAKELLELCDELQKSFPLVYVSSVLNMLLEYELLPKTVERQITISNALLHSFNDNSIEPKTIMPCLASAIRYGYFHDKKHACIFFINFIKSTLKCNEVFNFNALIENYIGYVNVESNSELSQYYHRIILFLLNIVLKEKNKLILAYVYVNSHHNLERAIDATQCLTQPDEFSKKCMELIVKKLITSKDPVLLIERFLEANKLYKYLTVQQLQNLVEKMSSSTDPASSAIKDKLFLAKAYHLYYSLHNQAEFVMNEENLKIALSSLKLICEPYTNIASMEKELSIVVGQIAQHLWAQSSVDSPDITEQLQTMIFLEWLNDPSHIQFLSIWDDRNILQSLIQYITSLPVARLTVYDFNLRRLFNHLEIPFGIDFETVTTIMFKFINKYFKHNMPAMALPWITRYAEVAKPYPNSTLLPCHIEVLDKLIDTKQWATFFDLLNCICTPLQYQNNEMQQLLSPILSRALNSDSIECQLILLPYSIHSKNHRMSPIGVIQTAIDSKENLVSFGHNAFFELTHDDTIQSREIRSYLAYYLVTKDAQWLQYPQFVQSAAAVSHELKDPLLKHKLSKLLILHLVRQPKLSDEQLLTVLSLAKNLKFNFASLEIIVNKIIRPTLTSSDIRVVTNTLEFLINFSSNSSVKIHSYYPLLLMRVKEVATSSDQIEQLIDLISQLHNLMISKFEAEPTKILFIVNTLLGINHDYLQFLGISLLKERYAAYKNKPTEEVKKTLLQCVSTLCTTKKYATVAYQKFLQESDPLFTDYSNLAMVHFPIIEVILENAINKKSAFECEILKLLKAAKSLKHDATYLCALTELIISYLVKYVCKYNDIIIPQNIFTILLKDLFYTSRSPQFVSDKNFPECIPDYWNRHRDASINLLLLKELLLNVDPSQISKLAHRHVCSWAMSVSETISRLPILEKTLHAKALTALLVSPVMNHENNPRHIETFVAIYTGLGFRQVWRSDPVSYAIRNLFLREKSNKDEIQAHHYFKAIQYLYENYSILYTPANHSNFLDSLLIAILYAGNTPLPTHIYEIVNWMFELATQHPYNQDIAALSRLIRIADSAFTDNCPLPLDYMVWNLLTLFATTLDTNVVEIKRSFSHLVKKCFSCKLYSEQFVKDYARYYQVMTALLPTIFYSLEMASEDTRSDEATFLLKKIAPFNSHEDEANIIHRQVLLSEWIQLIEKLNDESLLKDIYCSPLYINTYVDNYDMLNRTKKHLFD